MFNDAQELTITDTLPPTMASEPQLHNDGAIVRADLQKLAKYSEKLYERIQDTDEIDGWIQAKVDKATDFIASVYHYFEFEMELTHFGQKIENSDFYTEDQKILLREKLAKGREILAELKIKSAKKFTDITETPKSVKFGRKRKRLGATSFGAATRKKTPGLRKFKQFGSSGIKEAAPEANMQPSAATTKSTPPLVSPPKRQTSAPTEKAAAALWATVKQEARAAFDAPSKDDSEDIFYGEDGRVADPLDQDAVKALMHKFTKTNTDKQLGPSKTPGAPMLSPSSPKLKPVPVTTDSHKLLEEADPSLAYIRTLAGCALV